MLFKQVDRASYYSFMQGNRKCKSPDSDQFTFSLKSMNPDAYFNSQVVISFPPKLKKDGTTLAHTFPTYNNDKRWYTPAFLLDMDKNYSPQMEQQMQNDQVRKIKEAELSKQELFIPKPSHKNKYCSVCKSNYEEYIEHIQSSNHKKTITKSRFNKHVLDLCSTLFKMEQPVKSDREETTKEKEDEEFPLVTKKRKLEPLYVRKQTENRTNMAPYSPQRAGFQNQLMFLPQLPYPQFNPYYNYLPFPFSIPQIPFGYRMFYPPEMAFQPIPLMINSVTRIQ